MGNYVDDQNFVNGNVFHQNENLHSHNSSAADQLGEPHLIGPAKTLERPFSAYPSGDPCLGSHNSDFVSLSDFVNIGDNRWKTRKNRDMLECNTAEMTFLNRVGTILCPDLIFALGDYHGGKIFGRPRTYREIFSNTDTSSFDDEVRKYPEDYQIKGAYRDVLKQIESCCSMSAVRFLGYLLGKAFASLFSRINVYMDGINVIRNDMKQLVDSKAGLMLLPTHRSHLDYLIMSYALFGFNLPTPLIAAGENLNIPVLGRLFSAAGAFFLRRSFRGDDVYKDVFTEYLLRQLRDGQLIEVFVEGGRSRTGAIGDPKLGIISMAVNYVLDDKMPDIVLLPTTIDYENALETSEHVNQQLGGKKQRESLWGALVNSWKTYMGEKSGDVYVSFGSGISIKQVLDDVDSKLDKSNLRVEGNNHLGKEIIVSGLERKSVPRSLYVRAVADAVVSAQHYGSFVSPVALFAARLLSCETIDMSNPKWSALLLDDLILLAKLVVRSGVKTSAEFREGYDSTKAMLVAAEALSKIVRMMDVSDSASSKESTHKEADAVYLLARQRLILRYSCGELPSVLASYGVVAQICSNLSGQSTKMVPLEIVFQSASALASMLRESFPSAALEMSDLSAALDQLRILGILEYSEDSKNLRWTNSLLGIRLLGTLKALIGPAVFAFRTVLECIVLQVRTSDNSITEENLIKQCQEYVIRCCKSSSPCTGNVHGSDVLESAIRQAKRKTTFIVEQEIVKGFPESLSIIEIRRVIRRLKDTGIISHLPSSRSASCSKRSEETKRSQSQELSRNTSNKESGLEVDCLNSKDPLKRLVSPHVESEARSFLEKFRTDWQVENHGGIMLRSCTESLKKVQVLHEALKMIVTEKPNDLIREGRTYAYWGYLGAAVAVSFALPVLRACPSLYLNSC